MNRAISLAERTEEDKIPSNLDGFRSTTKDAWNLKPRANGLDMTEA